MKKLFCVNLAILFVMSMTDISAASTGSKKPLSRKSTSVVKDRTGLQNYKNAARITAAEERAKNAEQRAIASQNEAAIAATEARFAREQARQALDAAQQANQALAQIQQILLQAGQTKSIESSKGNLIEPSVETAQSPQKTTGESAIKNAVTAQQSEGVPTSASKFPLKIYGSLLLNTTFGDSGSNNIDIPLFAQKRDATSDQNHKNFNMTSRQSRLGLRYEGSAFKNAKLSGVFEFDLFGGKPALPNGEHFDLFRLRLAYGRIDWQNDSFEAGQDWSVFAPLNPTTLASFAIPGFATSGNLWYRMPQIRYEHRQKIGEKSKLIITVALLDPNAGDHTGNPDFRPIGLGERGALPAFETRLGFTTQAQTRESSGGFSIHYSRQLAVPGNPVSATVKRDIQSYGLNADWSIWASSRVRFSGEVFHGQGLGVFSGSIAQSVTVLSGIPKALHSTGGWFEIHSEAPSKYDGAWKKLSLNFGYGIEENSTEDLTVGMRKRNQTFMGNTLYKFMPNFAFAVEYRQVRTDWFKQPSARHSLNWVNTALLFSF
jgi:hypothetical protein